MRQPSRTRHLSSAKSPRSRKWPLCGGFFGRAILGVHELLRCLAEGAPAFDPDRFLRASGFCRTGCAGVPVPERRGGESLFLRKQLALFQERKTKPRRADDSTRWLMGFVSRWFDWRHALVVVKPETLIRWHRKGF